MEKRLQRRIPLLMGMLMLTAGCASITRGVDADPSGIQVFRYSGIGEITRDTISDPAVWLPLAGAAVLQIGDWDRRVSNWARSSTPVFGSTQSAERWSDRLRAFPAVFEAGSVLLQPGGDDLGSWLTSKAQVGAVDLVAVGSTMLAVKGLKGATKRLRPNGTDRESFPSGHAASAAANGAAAKLNLEYLPWDDGVTRVADYALDASVYGTAWARVEAGDHYPSDSLVAIALGRFGSSVIHRSFLGGLATQKVSLIPRRDGARIQFSLNFQDP